jgi:GxxExxY protein
MDNEIYFDDVSHELHEKLEKYEGIIFKDESYAIQGAIFEVYRLLGSGFLEAVYQECLSREFTMHQIPFKAQVELPLTYKGKPLIQTYRADFICFDQIIIELKALKDTGDEHRAQVFDYLKITGYRLGLLVNFGHFPRVTIERIVV